MCIRDSLKEAEKHRGTQCRPRLPFGEDQRGEGDIAASRRHLTPETGLQGSGHIGARNAAENAGDGDCGKAQPDNRDTRRIHRSRVFPHSPQPQAETGAVKQPPAERHRGKGGIDQNGMARQHLGIEGAKDRHRRKLCREGQVDGVEAGSALQRRGAPTLTEQRLRHQNRDPRGDEVQRHP